MSNSAARPDEVISLPKGGGALSGIGEKFSPDLFTGTGNFTVPIALPPGRNGFQPQLNLVYSTGNGNGPFGLGWSLSIPGVSRKTFNGVPRYNEAEPNLRPGERRDVFILSGAEDLVPVDESNPRVVRYRPRTEGLFAQIERHLDDNNDYWLVKSKDGLVSHYGTPGNRGTDFAVITKLDSSKAFAWKLTETQDPFGNVIRYEYGRDNGEKDGHRWDQPLLKRICYVDYGDPAHPRFLVVIEFKYDDERPDPFSDYRAGFEIRTTKRCRAITICTHTEEKAYTVREYRFAYQSDPYNGVSLLQQIDIIGYDDAGNAYHADGESSHYKKQLPPLTFGYTSLAPEQRQFEVVSGNDLPTCALSAPHMELVDLHGSGLPDILEMNGVVRYWRNLGHGRFDIPRVMREAPPHALADPGVQLIDADGDGRMDLLVTSAPLAGYYPLTHHATWDPRSFRRYERAPSFNLDDPEVRLVDLDGDGYTDILRSGSRLECFFNDPDSRLAWQRTNFVPRRALEAFPNVSFADPRVKLADMTGDGLQDIALIHDGNVEYWPNLGHGNWGQRIAMRRAPRFPDGYDPQRILLGDIDGDGLADIVYVDHDRVMLWLNHSGNAWSQDPIVIQGTPPVTSLDHVRLVDLYGTGVSGVLWSSEATSLSRHRLMFLDFTGGVKPYVLNEMDNHMGAVTRVQYRPSTRDYLDDQKNPKTRWRTPLPFPVQVVAKVEVIDEISKGKLTTEYRYHHGYWDGAEREFGGFGMVEQVDTETFDDYHAAGLHGDLDGFEPVAQWYFSPPTLTKTWFHQGPVGEEFGDWEETDYTHEYWQEDPQLLGHTEQVNAFLKGYNSRANGTASPHDRRIKRDSLRTLRGSILRSELYALDDTDRQDRPYTVTEHAYDLQEIEAPTGSTERPRIFVPHPMAQRTTQWERGDDPMTQFTFTDDYDDFGQPRQQTSVALPRRKAKRQAIAGAIYGRIDGDKVNQTGILATHTRTAYATPDENLHPVPYIHDRVAQVRMFELDDPPPVVEHNPNDLAHVLSDQAEAARAVHQRFQNLLDSWSPGHLLSSGLRLIGHTLNHYDGEAFSGRSDGKVGPHGALTRSETLVFTATELNAAYSDGTGDRRPAYLDGLADLPAGAPADFATNLGYRRQHNSTEGYHDGYYADTQRRQFDVQDSGAAQKRGVVVAVQDPLGNTTTIQPEKYWLLPQLVTDPARLETQAEYDYRVMQPLLVTDPNENRTQFTFTPLGLLESIAVMGKEGELVGDTPEQPGTVFHYDFTAFLDSSPDARQPIFVHTIKRQQHRWGLVHEENRRRTENRLPPLTEAEIEALFPVKPMDQPGTSLRGYGLVAEELKQFPERFIQSYEYSDGFGRLMQTRTQAEELIFGDSGDDVGLALDPGGIQGPAQGKRVADCVVVSGWQVYDNKGQVVEKYEPFFSQGWEFQSEQDAKKGEHATLFYDPRGNVIRTLNADGSQQRVILGRPHNASQLVLTRADLEFTDVPAGFEPSPWETYTYDANDLADLTHHGANRVDASHHFTPTSTLLDAMGRVICQVERNGANPEPDWFITRSEYDVRGNLLKIIDALQRDAFIYAYDLLNNPLRTQSIDAGLRTSVLDAAGNLVEYRDSKGSVVLRQYDELNRLIHLWARDDAKGPSMPVTLRERLIYGDNDALPSMDQATARQNNLRGRPFIHYDEAGLLRFDRYDFKGNLAEKVRQVISDAAIAAGWIADWNASNADNDLDTTIYQTSSRFDALNRPVEILYPADVHHQRGKLTPHYNRAGALEKVALDNAAFVNQIAYNAKGQRVLITYGNDVMTRYRYDERTFQLIRLRTEGYQYAPGDPEIWMGTGNLLQDFTYAYDLAGNITSIHDRTPDGGIPDTALGQDALDREFTYDPLYRLLSATGRECDQPPAFPGWQDTPRCVDLTKTGSYTQTYEYDPAGNITRLSHAHFRRSHDVIIRIIRNRQFDHVPNTNRLNTVTVDTTPYAYRYDDNGNLIQENSERHFQWDHADRLMGFINRPADSSHASVEARYLYGADGMRVKKWVRTNGAGDGESRVYIDGIFEHYRWRENGAQKQNNRLHVMENQQRIALVREGDVHKDDRAPAVLYHLGDHLGSSNVIVGGDSASSNAFINYEEYFPYGETSFGSFGKKRYRYSGKERDEESGLYYYGARYLAPWLARWMSCDPGGMIDGVNLYQYVHSTPLSFTDRSGLQAGNPGERLGEVEINGVLYARYKATEGTWVSASAKAENIGFSKEEGYGAYLDIVLDLDLAPLRHPDYIEIGEEYLIPIDSLEKNGSTAYREACIAGELKDCRFTIGSFTDESFHKWKQWGGEIPYHEGVTGFFFRSDIQKFDDYILNSAARHDIDPDMIRTVMWIESVYGGFKEELGDALEWTGFAEPGGVRPMNVRRNWAERLGWAAEDVSNPEIQIDIATEMLANIRRSLGEGATVGEIYSIYNYSGQTSVSRRGMQAQSIYERKLWKNAK